MSTLRNSKSVPNLKAMVKSTINDLFGDLPSDTITLSKDSLTNLLEETVAIGSESTLSLASTLTGLSDLSSSEIESDSDSDSKKEETGLALDPNEEDCRTKAFGRLDECKVPDLPKPKRNVIDKLGEFEIIPEECKASKLYLITDSMVDEHYGDKFLDGFLKLGYDMTKLVIAAGEKQKNMDNYQYLVDSILTNGMDKKSVIVSLGGGVVNNIAGFIASCLYRGIQLVHFPTSMMAQVDAAIDFKQAINANCGKNLIGAYHAASRIVIDPCFLQTLPKRHLLNGLSESIKHALTQDPDFLKFMINHADRLEDTDFLEAVVRRTCQLKVPLLNGEDQTATSPNEMLPQYGHSIGHAVEHLSFDCKDGKYLLHGEGIAIGMCISAEISLILGYTTQDVVDKHYQVFELFHLPVYVPEDQSPEEITHKMVYDKHFVQLPRMGLPTVIGDLHHTADGIYGDDIEAETLLEALKVNIARRDATKSI